MDRKRIELLSGCLQSILASLEHASPGAVIVVFDWERETVGYATLESQGLLRMTALFSFKCAR